MDQKQRTKLELIRIEGIWKMLLKKVEDDAQLTTWVGNVTNTLAKDVRKTIMRLSRYQLIKVIELAGNAISKEDIDNAYEQYRYGLKPGFTLFNIQSSQNKSAATAYNLMVKYLSEILYQDGAGIKSITAKTHSLIDTSVIEFAFYYHIKHNYLSENEEPSFIYEYKECFVWIDNDNSFLVIQNTPDRVTTILKNAFIRAYSARITNIKLTKKLIDEIFGSEKIKKGTFINPNASATQIEKMTISDSHFAEKQTISQTVSGCDMTGTYLSQIVGENQNNTLGINCNKGRLYLTSNVSATVFREWSIEKIKNIIGFLKGKANYEDFAIFQARNLTDLPFWSDYKPPQKKLIEQILYALYVAHLNKQDSYDIMCSISDLRTIMNPFFYQKLNTFCEYCEEPFIPQCDCGGSLSVTKNGELLCTECGQDIDRVHCDEGHEIFTNALESIVLFPNASLLANIRETMQDVFSMSVGSLFQIYRDKLVLLPEQNGYIVQSNTIPELKAVLDIPLERDIRSDLLKKVKLVKEKCKRSTNSSCNVCESTLQNLCVMKLFTTFPEYRPSPHQAGEFGDVSFTVTLANNQCQLVGIAKSSTKGETLTTSTASAREMLQQVLTATHDIRTGIIAVICAMRFHDQLIEELRYIAKITGKPIVILDDQYMVCQYFAFQKKQNIVNDSPN